MKKSGLKLSALALAVAYAGTLHTVARATAASPSTAVQTAVSSASAAQIVEKHDGYKLIKNVVYAPDRNLAGDLYLPDPSDGQLHPAVIIVHGGGWRAGDRTFPGETDLGQRLARHGYVAFSVDYRLIQDGGIYPLPIRDVNDAFGYLVSNAAKWGVDEQRIGMFGASAGGTLAMLSAYAPHDGKFAPQTYKDTKAKAKAVVAYEPLTDMRDTEYTWVIKWMDDTPWHMPEMYAEASPISYASSAVPTLCVHGTKDSMVDFAQSEKLVKELQAKGVKAELVPIVNARHSPFHEEPGPIREKAFAELIRFFDANLKG